MRCVGSTTGSQRANGCSSQVTTRTSDRLRVR
jgi:hypothetical protein